MKSAPSGVQLCFFFLQTVSELQNPQPVFGYLLVQNHYSAYSVSTCATQGLNCLFLPSPFFCWMILLFSMNMLFYFSSWFWGCPLWNRNLVPSKNLLKSVFPGRHSVSKPQSKATRPFTEFLPTKISSVKSRPTNLQNMVVEHYSNIQSSLAG